MTMCLCGMKDIELRPWPPPIGDMLNDVDSELAQKFKDVESRFASTIPQLCGCCRLKKALKLS